MTDTKGTAIREARRRAKLSAEDAAQRVGISLGWYYTVERAPGLAGPELMARIASALGVDAGTVRLRPVARRMVGF